MPCGRRRPGPRRWGVGEEQFCAVQVGRGRQCAGSSQGRRRGRRPRVNPFEPARDRGGYGPVRRSPTHASGALPQNWSVQNPTAEIGFLRSSNTAAPWAPPAPGEDTRIGNGQDPPGGPPFASGRSCDGRSRMSRSLVPPWRGRHRRGHAAHRAHGISHSPWPPPCSGSGRTGYACGSPTTPPTTIGRLPATAEGSESRDKDERGTLRRYRSRYWAVRSATASPPGPGTRLRARSGRPVLAAVGWKSRVGVWFAS